MIWGTIEHMVTRKSLLGEPADLMSLSDHIFQMLFRGIRRLEEPADVRLRLTLEQNPNNQEEGV
jgi:hypothetical protein